jgi:2'-5' RNA ligase
MTQIAIDVVLLPDAVMTGKAITWNRELVGRYAREIVLDARTRLPHISLAMGCIVESDLEAIQGLLQELAEQTPALRLHPAGTDISANSLGQKVTLLEIQNSPELQTLHESVMTKLAPYFRHEADATMIHDDVVAETTLEWIRGYREKAAFERFRPHITIGYGELPAGWPLPSGFGVSKLALCHLGNHCTCRRVLASVSLKVR